MGWVEIAAAYADVSWVEVNAPYADVSWVEVSDVAAASQYQPLFIANVGTMMNRGASS